jgi:hypothetical protein
MNSSFRPEIVFRVDGVVVDDVSFGIVPAGESRFLSLQVTNKGPAVEVLKVAVDSPDVEVLSHPDTIGDGFIILKYSPPVDAEQGLRTKVFIEGQYLV